MFGVSGTILPRHGMRFPALLSSVSCGILDRLLHRVSMVFGVSGSTS